MNKLSSKLTARSFVGCRGTLGLVCCLSAASAADLLATVLCLFDLLAAGLLLLLEASADQAVLRLELLGSLEVVVDETEAGALAATNGSPEPEKEHTAGILDLVQLDKVFLEVLLGHVRETRVDHIHQHLATLQKRVPHELAGTDCHVISHYEMWS